MRLAVLIAIFLAFAAYSYADCQCSAQTATYCDGDFLVTNTYTGTCNSGACDYITSETECQYGCYDNQCNVDLCAGVTCNSPPAAHCDGNSLVIYDNVGSCGQGVCDYASSSITCSNGCSGSSCVNDIQQPPDQPYTPPDPLYTGDTDQQPGITPEPPRPLYSGPPNDLYAWPLGSNWFDPVKRNYNIPLDNITKIMSSRAPERVTNVTVVTLNDKLVYYNVMTERDAVIFFFFHVNMKSYYYLEHENLTIVQTVKPFWSFLAE